MLTQHLSIFITSPAKPRKRARILPRIALALATLATAGLFNTAHATFPGENGVIVFDSLDTSGESVIKRVSPDNSAVATLVSGKQPSVSPNGKKIAYLSDDNRYLYVMDIDGSHVVQLTNENDQALLSPAWLPDGSKVVFGRMRAPNGPIDLWTINPDGSGKTLKRNLLPYPNSLLLAWSPSGNSYSFHGLHGVYIADDVNPVITLVAQDGVGSSWAPGGDSILVSKYNLDQFEIGLKGVRNVPPGGVPQTPSAISPDGKFIAGGLYDTYGVPLLVTRKRAGTPTTFTWATRAYKTDWSRVPRNCFATTPQGGGGDLPGDVDFYADQCAIVVMPDGGAKGVLQQAIAIGPDQRLYHRAISTGSSTWANFAVVPGGGGNPLGIRATKIAIAASKDGSAQVVIVNAADNLVYHTMRGANGTWSGFAPIDGWAGAAKFAARDVAITINGSSPTSPGNAQVIANGLADGNVYHRVRWPAGNWSPFQQLPTVPAGVNAQEIAIAADESGYTDVVIMRPIGAGGEGQIGHILRDVNSNWGNWTSVPTPGVWLSQYSDVAVTRTLNGTAQLAFTDAAGNVLFQERSNPNLSSSWTEGVDSTSIIGAIGRTVSLSPGGTAKSSTQILSTVAFPQ